MGLWTKVRWKANGVQERGLDLLKKTSESGDSAYGDARKSGLPFSTGELPTFVLRTDVTNGRRMKTGSRFAGNNARDAAGFQVKHLKTVYATRVIVSGSLRNRSNIIRRASRYLIEHLSILFLLAFFLFPVDHAANAYPIAIFRHFCRNTFLFFAPPRSSSVRFNLNGRDSRDGEDSSGIFRWSRNNHRRDISRYPRVRL